MDEKKNVTAGWTEAEMAEGHVEQPQPERAKGVPDMSRREDFAGRTVQRGDYDFTYDELGYCISAIRVRDN